MKYASVKGERREAQPKLYGICPNCDREVVAKCGQQRIWHWSHLGKLECDRWWEPETKWHRTWKAVFPQEWQEVMHTAADSERHIADVMNNRGWVLELQHSPITPEERLSRERFYGSMVWVVDGMRYKRDLAAFRQVVENGSIISDSPLRISSPLTARAGIFRRWAPIHWPVFIDFGDEEFRIAGFPPPEHVLWQLQLVPRTGDVVVAPVIRESFKRWFGLDGGALQHLVALRPEQPPRRRYTGGRPPFLPRARPRRRF
ncbi:competence protein CoiA [Bosea sp. 2YAB26]|uniref:competence protein CoiA n=1 Tax=Bosea sp. 2YAB26 TaxID=3237478 RepID=UPI003F929CE9